MPLPAPTYTTESTAKRTNGPRTTRTTASMLVLSWDLPPFLIVDDLAAVTTQRSRSGVSVWSVSLFPRAVQIGSALSTRSARETGSSRAATRRNLSYLDAIRPNSWVWILFDPHDGRGPDCEIIGLVDRVSRSVTTARNGTRQTRIRVTGAGWEKALESTRAMSVPVFSGDATVDAPTLWDLLEKRFPAAGGTRSRTVPVATAVQEIVAAFLGVRAGASAPTTPDAVASAISEASEGLLRGDETGPLRGQFNIPHVGRALSEFIRYDIDERVTEVVQVSPATYWGSLSESAMALTRSHANEPLNDLIFDVRPLGSRLATRSTSVDTESVAKSLETINATIAAASEVRDPDLSGVVGRWAPTITLRQRPLFEQEVVNTPHRVNLNAEHLASEDIGTSDADLVNALFLSALGEPGGNIGQRMIQEGRFIDVHSIRRNGLRYSEIEVACWPSADLVDVMQSLQPWVRRLYDAYRVNDRLLSGSVTVPTYVRELWAGAALTITRRGHGVGPALRTRGESVQEHYIIESVGRAWRYPDAMTTEIQLSRGYTDGAGIDRAVPQIVGVEASPITGSAAS